MCTHNPPHDIELEGIILGWMACIPRLIKIACRILSNLDFYSTINQFIFVALQEMFQRGAPIDLALLYSYMHQNNGKEDNVSASYLSSLLDGVPKSSIKNFEFYCYRIKQLSMLRDIQRKCYKVLKGVNHNHDSIKELMILRRRIDDFLRFNSAIKKQNNSSRGKNDSPTTSFKI